MIYYLFAALIGFVIGAIVGEKVDRPNLTTRVRRLVPRYTVCKIWGHDWRGPRADCDVCERCDYYICW